MELINYIADFAEYLNQNGFMITEEHIERFLKMMRNADFSDYETVLAAMKTTFARSPKQSLELPSHFIEFLKKKRLDMILDEIEEAKKNGTENAAIAAKRRELKKSAEHDEEFAKEAQEAIDGMERAIKEKAEKARLDYMATHELSFTNQKQIDKKAAEFKRMKLSDEKRTDFVKKCVLQKDYAQFVKYSETEVKQIRAEVYKAAEEALKKGNAKKFEAMTVLYKAIDHLSVVPKQIEKETKEAIEKATRQEQEEIKKLQNEMLERERARKALQREIDKMLNEERRLQIEKERSLIHREDFIGKHAVRAELIDEHDKTFEKDFKKLTAEEKRRILNYIRKNVLKFKTRMTRNVLTEQVRNIDMMETIKQACRTGGIPFNIEHSKPHQSKADLLLVLDVSGSCKEASEMMLTFIGILKEVFPRGCRAFAFVNSLYDISSVYDSLDIESSVAHTLEMIPRRGVYSNYYEPFKSLWEEQKSRITKDTVVIFIGDARNNKNKSGEEFIKNISRKARSAYFMNTEKVTDWNTADSIASLYGKYAKMQETRNVEDIIKFLEKLR